MSYAVKELFFTLQGEGIQTGRPAVFLRFAGCNLWSGRERHRARAVCQFCDTDFVGTDGPGGGRFATPRALAMAAAHCWSAGSGRAADPAHALVVCTGGEPLLQLDSALIAALHQAGLGIAVETNGTRRAPAGIDWLCVSPKAGAPLVQRTGDELKLVYPQPDLDPRSLEGLDFRHWLLQPMDGPEYAAALASAIAYCKRHPRWRLSVQTHKVVGLP